VSGSRRPARCRRSTLKGASSLSSAWVLVVCWSARCGAGCRRDVTAGVGASMGPRRGLSATGRVASGCDLELAVLPRHRRTRFGERARVRRRGGIRGSGRRGDRPGGSVRRVRSVPAAAMPAAGSVGRGFGVVVAGLLAAGSPLANHRFNEEVGKYVRHACAVAGVVGAPCCDIN
jgi:hypothetical protein